MIFSSSKPLGTNCNFLNSVSSGCHEHFESYYKYFLNNFTFKGAFFLQIPLTMFFPHFFFLKSVRTCIGRPLPTFSVKGMILLCYRKISPLPSSTPFKKLKSQDWSHRLLKSGMSKGEWLRDKHTGIRPSRLSQNSRKTRSSAPWLSGLSCVSVFYQEVI